MTPLQYARLREMYFAAVETPAGRREAVLRPLRSAEPSLCRAVERLLEHEDAATGFLHDPALPLAARDMLASLIEDHDRLEAEPPVPPSIGPFRIIRVLGRGGMGTVYEAQQEHPARLVALKVVRPELVGASTLRRFELEIRILGRLQHAGIARIYEAGVAHHEGMRLPYYVMERVDGLSLSEAVDAAAPAIRDRIRLFIKLCEAVQYAHLQGVVHRDLKPGNVLVDGHGQPKILDFGVARALDDRRIQAAGPLTLTVPGQLVGTMAYMSPEQAGGDPRAVDVRSDIYSLGVMLYQILTGSLPFRLDGKGLAEASRLIAEAEPPRPRSLRRELRGDLDAIILKSLEKDRSRRYQSAGDLAADLRRCLAHEPVQARPVGVVYRWRKFARRHRVLVAAMAAVAVVLAVGASATAWQAFEALRARRDAEAEASRKSIALNFLRDVLSSPSPRLAASPDITMRQVLDAASRRLQTELASQPEIMAEVADTIGMTYFDLGLYDDAQAQVEAALRIRERLLPPTHPDLAASCVHLADIRHYQRNFLEAEPYYVRAEGIYRAQRGDFREPVARCMRGHGLNLAGLCRYDEARPALEESISLRREVWGDGDERVAESLSFYAFMLLDRADFIDAERAARESLDIVRRVRGDDDLATAIVKIDLAAPVAGLGRLDESLQLLDEARLTCERLLESAHPQRVRIANARVVIMTTRHQYAQAEALARQTIAELERRYGRNHYLAAMLQAKLGAVLCQTDRFDEAIRCYDDAIEASARFAGQDPWIKTALIEVAGIYWARGEYQEAERRFRQALSLNVDCFGDHSHAGALAKNGLGVCLREEGRLEEAQSLLLEAIDDERGSNPDTLACLPNMTINLAKTYAYQGDIPQAMRRCAEAAAMRLQRHGARSPEFAETMILQGRLLIETGQAEEAEPILREAVGIYLDSYDEAHSLVVDAREALGHCLAAQRRFDEAEPILLRSLGALCQSRGEGNFWTRRAADDYAAMLAARASPGG